MNLIAFVVCEEIRNELNENRTLLGVKDKLVFNHDTIFPVGVRIAFYMRAKKKLEEAAPDEILFQIIRSGEPDIVTVGRPGTAVLKDYISFAVNMNILVIKNTGVLNFKLTFKKGDSVLSEFDLDPLEMILGPVKAPS